MNFDPKCIDVYDFLECLDITSVTHATAEEVRFSCPFPAHAMGDETPSAYMNVESTAFFCHACHAKGNAIHFTQQVLGISLLEAIRMLKARYSPGGIDPDARDMVAEVRKILDAKPVPESENPILDEGFVKKFEIDWIAAYEAYARGNGWPATDYMFKRKFNPHTLNEWQFGYDHMSQRIVLPVRTEEGALTGFKARAWDGRQPKYLNLGGDRYGFPSFFKNNIVFGLDRAKEISTDLIVVEGELNAVAMSHYGYPNTVAINGSYFGPRQIRLLKKYADSVTLFFDSDPAGFDATKQLMSVLKDFMDVYVVPDHDSDPADMALQDIKDCLDEKISSTSYRMMLRSM